MADIAPAVAGDAPMRPGPAGNVDSGQRQAIERYVASLPADAPLRKVVAEPSFQQLIAMYEVANQAALDAQKKSRHSGRTWLVATSAGSIVGAILLSPLENLPKALGLLQTLALFVSLGALYWISRKKPVDNWMKLRGEAEERRAQIFRQILDAPHPTGVDPGPLTRQKLDCFTAAHLDYQLAYYKSAAVKFRNAAGQLTPLKLLSYGIFGVALVFGASILMHLLQGAGFSLPTRLVGVASAISVDNANRWQLALSTIAATLLTFANACSDMDQNARNASRYEATAALLQGIRDQRLAELRAAADAGDQETVQAFADAVQAVLSHEHLAWYMSMETVRDRLRQPHVARPAVLDRISSKIEAHVARHTDGKKDERPHT